METNDLDVLIIGAGLSGIGAARHLQQNCPDKSYAIIEARAAMGGTWDLFRYPGIRSDSDMYTLGYNFKPWTLPRAIADGPSIRDYIRTTAIENGIDRHIRYQTQLVHADWSESRKMWTVTLRDAQGQTSQMRCNFLFMCTGYYDYAAGYTPEFPGVQNYQGQLIHPQYWPEQLDYRGKNIVIIGSGATAVTLVPALAERAAHVTMLQRSPTYVVSVPREDHLSNTLRKVLPEKLVYRLARTRNVGLQQAFYKLSRAQPTLVRRLLLAQVRHHVGRDFDMQHFSPRYKPWDERLCAVPDGDLFAVLRSGQASVVTDQIDSFTAKGIRLASGKTLEADIVVTATGLQLQMMGGTSLSIDGRPVDMARTMNYKGVMFRDIPNLAMVFGYTNASWTLKADLSAEYVCRLLRRMDQLAVRVATPRNHDPKVQERPFLEMASGYVQRALARFPRQGSKAPWRVYQNYALDLMTLRYAPIEDGCMELSGPRSVSHTAVVSETGVSEQEARPAAKPRAARKRAPKKALPAT